MRPVTEQITRAGKPYHVGRLVDAQGKELARSPVTRVHEGQAKADAAALQRDWLASRVKRHPEERERVPRDPDMLAAWDAGVPMQGPP